MDLENNSFNPELAVPQNIEENSTEESELHQEKIKIQNVQIITHPYQSTDGIPSTAISLVSTDVATLSTSSTGKSQLALLAGDETLLLETQQEISSIIWMARMKKLK
ncbi:hypothetical protein ABEB36_009305 [Hypothenemus hampei]|uniref:Uncharacterized protein n=1 Tax=Hypothenemus hampei TaxID=57062 RepID=A0ABD1EFZ3_HYPHA